MIKMSKMAKIDRRLNPRFASIKNVSVGPSFMQSPEKAPPSDFRRSHLTTMELGSTCRRNPRISTVR
jgi:hypothetical protein